MPINTKLMAWPLNRTNAVEKLREKRKGAKDAEKRRVKRVSNNPPFGDRILINHSLRRSAFSASLRLFRPNSTERFRLKTIFRPILFCWVALGLALLLPGRLFAGGEEVVVIYNSKLPESKTLAYYYARMRTVPKEQVLGFDLSTAEVISRDEYRNTIERPLLKKLEALKLWRFGAGELPGTNHTTVKAFRKVTASKIRYAVLCYGVPLKIRSDPTLQEPGDDKLRPELRRNEAAVDSELSLLPRLTHGYPLAGPWINPLYYTTNAASLHPTNGLLIVARLDGATPEIAHGLVDKALRAERDGLWGRAYFDVRNIADPNYKIGDDWIRGAAQCAQQAGFDTVVDEHGNTFPAGFPLSQIAFYAGWYSENQTGPFTLPKVEFMPGAFAYHLHSFSAASLRVTNHNWTGPLLAQGVTCTFGTVDEPYLTGTPDVAAFTGRWMFSGFTFGEAVYAAQIVLSWQTTVVGDPLYAPFKRPLLDQHRTLLEQTNKLVEWSTARLINQSRNQGVAAADLALALETAPEARDSAVLTEKLADLFVAQGKPASAILTYERALKLSPTPQQRVRLRLTLGEKLLASGRPEDAGTNYQKLLTEMPDYADAESIRQKIHQFTEKTAGTNSPSPAPGN